MRKMWLLACAVAIGALVSACGGDDSKATTSDAGSDATASVDSGDRASDANASVDSGGAGGDGGADGAGDAGVAYPAFRPAVPQLLLRDGGVLHTPKIRPVYFAAETLATPINDRLTQWLGTTWAGQTAEYGIGAATLAPITLTEAAGTTLTDTDIESWLKAKLDGSHAEFGPVDAATLANEVFVLFYPSTTTITAGTETLCQLETGYHNDLTLAAGPGVTYAVVPRCTSSVDAQTTVASQLVIAAASDPSTMSPGWAGFDADHEAWGWAFFGPEISHPCQLLPPAILGGDGGVAIGRSWSNVAMRGYHDPCLPAPAGAYFAAVPIMLDDVRLNTGFPITKGVSLTSGQSKTIDVQLLSDGPTTGPWTVSADVSRTGNPSPATFAFDRTSGQNGDTLRLTITMHNAFSTLFVVTSTLGTRKTQWAGLVSSH